MSDQGSQPISPGTVSPDGLHVWDGSKWWDADKLPVGTSLDGGHTSWDGHAWVSQTPHPSDTSAVPTAAPQLWETRDGNTLTMDGWIPTPIVEERRKQAEDLDRSSGVWALFTILLLPLGIVAFVKNRKALKLGRPVNAKVTGFNGWVGLGLFAAWIVLLVGIVIYTQTAQGFHDAQTLSDSVVQEINGNLAKQGQSTRVTTVTCVESGSNDATCLLTFDNGTQTSISVTIANDGSSWVTK